MAVHLFIRDNIPGWYLRLARLNALGVLFLLLLALLSLAETVQAQEDVILTISVQSEHININQSTGVLVSLTNRAGEPLVGQEITFTTDRGKVDPDRAITDASGEVWVTFIASGQPGISYITASARGVSEMIVVAVALSTFQWIATLFLCVLGFSSIAGTVVLLEKRSRRADHRELQHIDAKGSQTN